MNIFVLVKQVPDTETKIKVAGNNSSIDMAGIKWIISPYDEFAIEEAIKTKETKKIGTVTVLCAGPDRVIDALRTALAMGADNAVHLKMDQTDSYAVSKAISEVLKKEKAELVLAGKQAIDDDQAAVFGYVAEFLDWPSVSDVNKLEIGPDNKSAKATKETEGGSQWVIQTPFPAVLAVTKGLNTPRYASLPGIMKAKKKEIKTYTPQDLGLNLELGTEESEYKLPPERAAGKKLSGELPQMAAELVKLLREEAKVL